MENLGNRILTALTNGQLTIGQLAKALSTESAKVTSADLRKDLRTLRQEGRVTVNGAKRSATYSLVG